MRTVRSSPAEAKTKGSLGCQATQLTQPDLWASSFSTRLPFERQIWTRESADFSMRWKSLQGDVRSTYPRYR